MPIGGKQTRASDTQASKEAVEIKNGVDDTRAQVAAEGTAIGNGVESLIAKDGSGNLIHLLTGAGGGLVIVTSVGTGTNNPAVFNTNVASAGTPNDHDLNTPLTQNAHTVTIKNTHNSGTLEVDSSYDGAAFVGTDIEIPAGESYTMTLANIDTLRVDASENGTTYWVRAW